MMSRSPFVSHHGGAAFLLAAAWLLLATACLAQSRICADDASLRAALSELEPGDTLRIAPGVYRGGIHASLQGAEKQPIVIEAADAKKPPVLRGGNGLQIAEARHVTLRGLVIANASHNGLNIDDGGKRDGQARGIVLEDLTVRMQAPGGNRDGIKLSGIDAFRVENCLIESWGRGGSGIDMVGCHDGVLRGCTLRHVPGQGHNGIQAKGGSERILIERCYFEHAGMHALYLGGSTGRAYFRPKDARYEARALTVQDCVIVGSAAAVAFVSVDGASFRHNLVLHPTRWVLRILRGTEDRDFVLCRRGIFERNIVIWKNDALRTLCNVGPGTEPGSFRFAHNWWYCEDAPARSTPRLPSKPRSAVIAKDPGIEKSKEGRWQRATRAKSKSQSSESYGPREWPMQRRADPGMPGRAAPEQKR